MQYTTFGATGLTVPRLCLGTATFGHQADETVAHQIMDTAAEAGVTFFDSADIYPIGGEEGDAEEIVGRRLQAKRDQIILDHKALVDPWAPPAGSGAAPANICWTPSTAHFHRLGTDYVDIYQLHFDGPDTPLDETLATLDAIVTAGKARWRPQHPDDVEVASFPAHIAAGMPGVCNFTARPREMTTKQTDAHNMGREERRALLEQRRVAVVRQLRRLAIELTDLDRQLDETEHSER